MKNTDKRLKLLLFFAVLTVFSVNILNSAYLENLPTTVTQPDGSVLELLASGDEFFNFLHDENNYTIIVGDDGYYYYAILADNEPIASPYRVDSYNPEDLNLEQGIGISVEEYNRRRAIMEEPMQRSNVRAPHTGILNNLAVYIRFSDDSEFTIPRSSYDNNFNNPNGISMKNYFLEVSYDLLEIETHHYPIAPLTTNLSYQDSHPRSYYQPYHSVNNPNGYQNSTQRRIREHTLLMNAVNYVEDEIPVDLDIDADGDGYVDNVSFMIRGNSGNWADLLWAHRWVLYTYEVYIHGKRVWDYTFQPENQSGVYTLSHEMYHTLGAPDLYRYTNTGYTPVGGWDLMASGFVHMGAWMKYKYADQNWISEIPEITSSGTYTLNPLTSPENNAYRIISPFTNNEFFVVEYRRAIGTYESNLPGTGLVVYRIRHGINGNADGPPDEVYIYRPNGTHTQNGVINFAHFGSHVNRTAINDDTTNPTSFLSNGQPGGLNIYNIGQPGDTISFDITLVGDLVAPNNLYPLDNDHLVPVSLTFSWSNVYVADFYDFQLASDPEFNDLVIDEIYLMNTYYEVEGLEVDQTYYWRTRSNNYDGWSDWSNTWTFSTCFYSSLDIEMPGIAFGQIITADMNNNGFNDIVVSGRNNTSVYWNNGDGSFTASDQVFPNYITTAIEVADFNNNGWLDFVVTGSQTGDSSITKVYLNQGNGYFESLSDYIPGFGNPAIAVGDLNNNGFIDFIITGSVDNNNITKIYYNNGSFEDGNFFNETTSSIVGVIAGDIAFGDYNNNGRLDILISGNSENGPVTYLYENAGENQYLQTSHEFVNLVGSSLAWGDYNNNGHNDILISGMETPSEVFTKIYANQGDGTFNLLDVDITGIHSGSASWGDFNQNGYLDILISGRNNTLIYANDLGNFESVNAGIPSINNGYTKFTDINNNGYLDVVVLGSSISGTIFEVYINNLGENTFTVNTAPEPPTNLNHFVSCEINSEVTLIWDQANDDQTNVNSLSYNIRVGTTPMGDEIMASHSDPVTGFRKIPTMGNAWLNNSYLLKNLPQGKYYWSVQTIDSGYKASEFAPVQEFVVDCVSSEDVTHPGLITNLNSNYPNPFNPSTTISFSLAEKKNVNITVYNLKGQKVLTLIDEIIESGNHQVKWSGLNSSREKASSGIYFYRMKTDNYESIRKMIMLK